MEQDSTENQSVEEMLSILTNDTKTQLTDGELVVLYEAEFEDADGVLMAHDEDGGQRPMLVRQITDMSFVPNPDWIVFLMTKEKWEVAAGKDSVMWTSLYGDGAPNETN